jgi:Protein kinase domain/AAA ATPase domain/zinc-ribbon domain
MTCAVCGHENSQGARFCEECGTRFQEVADVSHLPETLGGGRYGVERFLGEGARKRVYLARDARLDRDVAVAVVKTEGLDEAGRHRIDREARATARLGDHAHIVTVFDVIEDAGGPQIVSEYVAGGTLAERLLDESEHRLPVGEAIEIAAQLATALEHAHSLGVVHRDVKPANVWLSADGGSRLGDFGLAAVTDASRVTSEGMVVGTVAYLAPEQATGRPLDACADLYSLGAVLYEMVAGRPPFLGEDAVSVISQHLSTAPVVPSWHNAAVPPGLDRLVLQLLAKDPGDRPQAAAEVAAMLRELVLRPPPALPESDHPALATDARRFVGRGEELGALRRASDVALGGESWLVLVVGEPGIGKTRLVEEAAVYARVHGAQVWWGRCYEGEVGAPFLPFVEALRSYVRGRSDDELREELGSGAPEIATLVSEIRQRLGDLPELPPLEGDAERMRLFDGVATFLANASRSTPIVVVLDDLHWADKPSLLLSR